MSDQMLWIIFGAAVLLCIACCLSMWIYTRRKYLRFCERILEEVRRLEEREPLVGETNEDTLESKVKAELIKLSKIYYNAESTSTARAKEIQQIVSDISHQLRTPIANIMMYNDMLLSHKMPKAEQKKNLLVMKEQTEKLHFLVQALIKMSRVESAMIVLDKKEENLYQCLAQAVAGISAAAEKKGLCVTVECPEKYPVSIDRKWTTEAIGNVLDNAVKYTPEGGYISIRVRPLDMFVRIDIEDDGIGIEEKHYNDVFRRFWRDAKVHTREGVGIGLYLTREIITRQGGYVKVSAAPGEGSCFSLYLPLERAEAL